ncbi:MAG: carboxypeptidase M32 [Candidatus Kariarchaeaceae archaeon]|jgi:carboxypeptidase Taq
MNNEYKELLGIFEEIAMISSIEGVLGWDSETTLPFAGVEHRSNQYQYLGKKKHGLWNNPRIGDLIGQLDKNEALDGLAKRNVELMKREYNSRTKMPTELVGKLSAQSKKTHQVWRKAKAKNQFSVVLPDLKDLFSLTLDKANILADLKEMDDPYEALVTERDPGFTVQKLSTIFNETKSFMVPLAKKCADNKPDIDYSFLERDVPRNVKENLAEEIVKIFQYNSNSDEHAIIGEVEHPLTMGLGPKDIRVTVKYENFEKLMFTAAHEVGHAIHGLNRNPEWVNQPVNSFGFPSVGECSSRYTENKIGRSYEFWEYFYPKFQEITKGQFKDIDLDTFYAAANRVEPGVSRMKADEVTYGLHIILRFEIERDLFMGKITVDELPQIWNEKYKEYLGVDVKSDTEGVMQDLHWYSIYFGYFQGYHLGDVLNSQIHEAMVKEIPDWQEQVRNGDLSNIIAYQAKNVYSKGGYYDPLDLVEYITGEPLSTKYLKNHLETKYSKLFKF